MFLASLDDVRKQKMHEDRTAMLKNVLDNPRWGSHFCLLYQTREDLIDVLLPYFKAGLKRNELCVWVTSEPLNPRYAEHRLRRAVRGFDGYARRGQIEILRDSQWYATSEKFNARKVMKAWNKKQKEAREKGFNGLRVAGDTFWLQDSNWGSFIDYELLVDKTIYDCRMVAVCSYRINKCGCIDRYRWQDLINIVLNHQFIIVKRAGKWQLIEASAHKMAIQKAREQNKFLHGILESLTHPFYVVAANDHTIKLSNSAAQRYGKATGSTCYALTHGRKSPCTDEHICPLEEVKRTKKPVVTEHVHYEKDGTAKHVQVHAYPIFDKNGSVAQAIEYSLDITDRKSLEEKTKRAHEQLELQINRMPIGFIVWDAGFRIQTWNPAAERIFGFTVEEAIGKHAYDLIVEEDIQPRVDEVWCRLLEGDATAHSTNENITKDGRTIICEWANTPLKKPDGTVLGVISMVQDVTEQRMAQRTLEESEQRYRVLFQNSPIALWEGDLSGVKKEIDNLRASGLLDFRKYFEEHPGAVVSLAAMIKVLDVNNSTLELYGAAGKEHLRQNLGRIFNEEVKTAIKEILIAMAEGKNTYAFETATSTLQGARKHVMVKWTVVSGYQDTWSRIMVSIVDMTEIRRLQEQLIRTEKLAAVGELVSGVAHEINNPLTGVLGFSELLRQDPGGLDENQKKQLDMVHSEAQRIKKIVSNLLSFARMQKAELIPVDINRIIETVLDMRSYHLKVDNIKVNKQLHNGLPKVAADAQQLQQVLLNIINNAQQAMQKSHKPGEMTIRSYAQDHIVGIDLIDNGPGIPKQHLKKVFDPFFTTKKPGEGTGLGLSVSYGIIKEHKGDISVESEEGKGTRFTIQLPITGEVPDGQ